MATATIIFSGIAIVLAILLIVSSHYLSTTKNEVILNTNLNDRVALLKLFPGINSELYKALFNRSKVDGLIGIFVSINSFVFVLRGIE